MPEWLPNRPKQPRLRTNDRDWYRIPDSAWRTLGTRPRAWFVRGRRWPSGDAGYDVARGWLPEWLPVNSLERRSGWGVVTVHETPVGATVEWYTPPDLFDALGLWFDLDPAASPNPLARVPASEFYHRLHDGLAQTWEGRVWLNPPYGPLLPAFVDRMCRHANGIMLTASRTETRWWQQAAQSADAVCLLRERLHFIRDDGHQARSSHASTLFAWGDECVEAIRHASLGWYTVQTLARSIAA